MATFTDYWRIVKPRSAKHNYIATDASDQGAQTTFNNYSWYTQIMRGAGTRLQSYEQFDNMDLDVDISRALDTIAEEMSNDDEKTSLPFEIDYQNDDNKEVDESIVMTIKAALRHWSSVQDLENRVFGIAHDTIKYGDCFFRKTSDHRRWAHIPSDKVLGIELDDNSEVVAYHLKSNLGKQEIESIPAAGMIHFTLSDSMGSSMPFGDSVLTPVVRAFKQMGLLEDSSVIYKIVRAPERRVFYIDVGNMPPQRVKAYLENVKNEMKQKRIPNNQGGQENVDSIYNPMSMTEDYFFGSTTNGRGSRVETLPGGEQTGENFEVRYFQDKVFRGMRVPSSYMKNTADSPGAVMNDGKTGVAYIEELRFANYVRRLQNKIEQVFDLQFKKYIKVSGIKVDENLFKIRLPDPQNFALYRQSLLNSELITTFSSADGIKFLSKRFILKKYLGFSEDDIQTNEALLRQERMVPESDNEKDDDIEVTDLNYFYDPDYYENRAVEYPDPLSEQEESIGPIGDESGEDARGNIENGIAAEPPTDDQEEPADEAPAEEPEAQ